LKARKIDVEKKDFFSLKRQSHPHPGPDLRMKRDRTSLYAFFTAAKKELNPQEGEQKQLDRKNG
jgi:hypothetical protein